LRSSTQSENKSQNQNKIQVEPSLKQPELEIKPNPPELDYDPELFLYKANLEFNWVRENRRNEQRIEEMFEKIEELEAELQRREEIIWELRQKLRQRDLLIESYGPREVFLNCLVLQRTVQDLYKYNLNWQLFSALNSS